MAKPSPSAIRRICPAAVSALLMFLPVFTLANFADRPHGGFNLQILPKWLEAVVAETVCAVATGIPVAFFTWYAEGKEHRIQEMLNRR